MYLKSLLVLALSAALCRAAVQVDCNEPDNRDKHTWCIYQQPKSTCQILKRTVDRVTQNFIIANHNKYRSLIACGRENRGQPGPQPAAKNMNEIRWDDDLAAVAQLWSNQCNISSDKLRNLDKYGGYVGQNVFAYVETLSAANLDDPASPVNNPCGKAVDAWFSQVSKFNRSRVDPFTFDGSTAQYSQMMWSNSYAVGCGFTQFTTSGNRVTGLCVCNYGAGGNRRNGKLYSPAASDASDVCADCPADTVCDRQSCLCVYPNPDPTNSLARSSAPGGQNLSG